MPTNAQARQRIQSCEVNEKFAKTLSSFLPKFSKSAYLQFPTKNQKDFDKISSH